MRSMNATAAARVLVLASAAVLFGSLGSAWAEEVRYHGFQMDETHKLIVEEENGTVRVTLEWRARPVGGKPLPQTRGAEEGKLGRSFKKKVLMQVRSEVLRPAGPNYLRNRGRRYRITVEGGEIAPDYVQKVELNAADARKFLSGEFHKLRARVTGIERDALYYGEVFAMRVLHDAGRLPPDIAETVKGSIVGRVRFTPKTLERRSLGRGAPLKPLPKPETPTVGETLELLRTPEGIRLLPPDSPGARPLSAGSRAITEATRPTPPGAGVTY